MKKIILLSVLLIAGCNDHTTASSEEGVDAKLKNGQVAKIAEAPDGTILWAVHTDSTIVYFASNGTQNTYSCGKNCTRTQNVPTAN